MVPKPGFDTFVGRARELDRLSNELAQAVSGHPRLVLLYGEAGIGKTTLVHRLLAHADPLSVLWGSADDAETDVPYAALDQIREIVPGGGALMPNVNAVSPPHAVGARLLHLLGALQRRGAVAIVLDDAQWADQPSLLALTFALRRLRVDRVISVVAVRPTHAHKLPSGMERLVDGGHGARIVLEGLTVEELGELVQQSRASLRLSPGHLHRLWEHSRGNPLWASALLNEVPIQRLMTDGTPIPAPVALARSARRMLETCSLAAKDLAAGTAVMGGVVPLGRLTRLVSVTEPFAALDEAVEVGLLELRGTPPAIEVMFSHPLLRSAVYDALDTALRTGLHRRAAQQAVDEGSRLRHEVAAATGPDEVLALRLAGHALRQRRMGSLAAAASAFATAAEVSPEPETRSTRVLDAIESHLMAGDVSAAMRLLEERCADITNERRHLYLRGWSLFSTGRFKDAEPLLREVAEGCDELAGSAATLLAYVELLRGHGDNCAALGERALSLSTVRWHRNTAAGLLAMGLFIAGRPTAAYATIEWLPDAGLLAPDELDAGAVRANLLLFDGELAAARAEYLALLQTSKASGRFLLVGSVLGNLAEVEYRSGHWDKAEDYAEQAVSLTTDLDQTWLSAPVHSVASPVYARRGRWVEADRHVAAAIAAAGALRDAASIAYAATAGAILAHSRRDFAGVLKSLAPLLQLPRADGVEEPGIFMWRELHIEALVRLGRLAEAESALRPFEEMATARGRRPAIGAAERSRGILETRRENEPAARQFLEASAAHFSEAGMPFEEALARLALGELLRRTGRRRAATIQLQIAAETFRGLGATPFQGACDVELAACGVRLIGPKPSTHAAYILSPQEKAVASRVAAGMRNKEVAEDLVLSVKTVEYHLSNVYAKLGVRSRTQLAHRLLAEKPAP